MPLWSPRARVARLERAHQPSRPAALDASVSRRAGRSRRAARRRHPGDRALLSHAIATGPSDGRASLRCSSRRRRQRPPTAVSAGVAGQRWQVDVRAWPRAASIDDRVTACCACARPTARTGRSAGRCCAGLRAGRGRARRAPRRGRGRDRHRLFAAAPAPAAHALGQLLDGRHDQPERLPDVPAARRSSAT